LSADFGNIKTAVKKTGQPANRGIPNEKSRATSVSTTVKKAVGILDILATKADYGINLTELSVLIDMPKSSTHRYLATLQELGLAERKDGERFCLGTKVIELAGSFLVHSDLRNESQSILADLSDQTGETIHLAVPSGTEVVYIAKIEGKHALGMFSHIGARLPMYCTALGKAILAFSDEKLLGAVLSELRPARTEKSITSAEVLREELAVTRERYFAVDDEENEMGIRCVGAPIFDFTATPIAAISISAPRQRVDRERYEQLGAQVVEAASLISRRKGYSGYPQPKPT
jgi:DNA-binding IclR family transcriptional regulator